MVRGIFTRLNREIRGIHQAAYLLGVFALLSQILALVRDRLFAHTFGAGLALDVYYTAFRIPDLIFVSIASLVSVSVLVPVMSEKIARNEGEGRQLAHSLFVVFFAVIVAVSAVAYFSMPFLGKMFFRGFSPETIRGSLVPLARIMLLSPLLLGFSNLAASITQAHRRFFLYAVSPLLYNAGIIFGIMFFFPKWGMEGLGAGVVLGAALHLAVQVPFIARRGFLPHPPFSIDWGSVRRIAVLSLPRTIALSAHQFVLLALIALAARGAEGSVSIFSLAFNLQSVPLTIIGVSYSVAALPTLSRIVGADRPAFLFHVSTALRHILFWSLPATALFIVLRAHFVRAALGSGAFGWTDTRLTAAALALFSLSVAAQSAVLLLTRGYYAAGKTVKPLVINTASSVAILALAFVFMRAMSSDGLLYSPLAALLRVGGVLGSAVLIFPLAYSLGMFLNSALLFFFFGRDFAPFPRAVWVLLTESIAASLSVGVASFFLLNFFDGFFDLTRLSGVVVHSGIAGAGGIVAGVITLLSLRNAELREIGQTVRTKFWRARVVGAEV